MSLGWHRWRNEQKLLVLARESLSQHSYLSALWECVRSQERFIFLNWLPSSRPWERARKFRGKFSQMSEYPRKVCKPLVLRLFCLEVKITHLKKYFKSNDFFHHLNLPYILTFFPIILYISLSTSLHFLEISCGDSS